MHIQHYKKRLFEKKKTKTSQITMTYNVIKYSLVNTLQCSHCFHDFFIAAPFQEYEEHET